MTLLVPKDHEMENDPDQLLAVESRISLLKCILTENYPLVMGVLFGSQKGSSKLSGGSQSPELCIL